jgi:uncharacterized protein (TIGR02266 family)
VTFAWQHLVYRMDRSKRRAHPRVPASVIATIRIPGGGTHTASRLTNISLGGVFIDMDDPLTFGTEVNLEFALPVRDRVIQCRGLVVWTSKHSGEAEGKRGIGVRLMNIGIADMRILADYIERSLRVEA